jgi:hypothetical protein
MNDRTKAVPSQDRKLDLSVRPQRATTAAAADSKDAAKAARVVVVTFS